MTKPMTYSEAGVDIFKEEKAIKSILNNNMMPRTQGVGKPLGGHYAGMIEFGENALVLCTDGVGSKVEIAKEINKYDTVGIDCIAMNVNDAICMGAEPLAFVDYLAIEDPKPEITQQIGKGLAKGAEQSNINIIGGETASLPELINGFDLAGTCLAYVKKTDIITGEHIQEGDVIIGLSSSGIHSNGYTLARKVIATTELSYTQTYPEGEYGQQTLGEVMLCPTTIYVKEILELIKHIPVKGLSHITGGGLRNLNRLNNTVCYEINNPLPVSPIFTLLQEKGNISSEEMYQTFNMGMGFAIIVEKKDVEETLDILHKTSQATSQIVGTITKGTGVIHTPLQLHYQAK